MKRHLVLILFVSLAGLLVACGSDAKAKPATTETPAAKILDITIGQDKNGQTVDVPKGAQLTVRLPSNRTTGFQWVVRQNTPSILLVSGDPQYESAAPTPAPGQPPIVGAGGTDVFTFRAVSSGTAPLGLAYVRSFEPNNPPGQTFMVTVNVK